MCTYCCFEEAVLRKKLCPNVATTAQHNIRRTRTPVESTQQIQNRQIRSEFCHFPNYSLLQQIQNTGRQIRSEFVIFRNTTSCSRYLIDRFDPNLSFSELYPQNTSRQIRRDFFSPPPNSSLLPAHLGDVVDRPHGCKGEHAEAPAGHEAHHHAAAQQQDAAEQRSQHVRTGRNLEGGK